MFLDRDEKTEPKFIEADEKGQLYVLGFFRGAEGVISDGFVSRFGDEGLQDIRTVSEADLDFYTNFKHLELCGFTDMSKEWSGFKYENVDMTGMENMKYPLSELWRRLEK